MQKITIWTADVREVECDVLILKYAQAFYGADGVVAMALGEDPRDDLHTRIKPQPHEHIFIESQGQIAAKQVLFVGVVPLDEFEYSEIRAFTNESLKLISAHTPNARHVAMTMHGVGYGLDERESFLAQLGGISDALAEGVRPYRISIVDRDERRAERIRSILRSAWPQASTQVASSLEWDKPDNLRQPITAGVESKAKPHVFVAMPFSKELEDVYVFGIQNPVNNAGYLCERVDMLSFTGDILDRIKSRIETSDLVIADLTGASPNVYLEVGYAWGKNRPTLLLARKSDELKFDVRGQRCIKYENIVDLSKKLQEDLARLNKD
jgi:hypothetical protein